MDLALFQRFSEQLSNADSALAGQGAVLPDANQLEALLAEQERHFNLPLIHADRQPLRHEWRNAWQHFSVLAKNKDLTHEAFAVFEALPWIGVTEAAGRMLATPQGQAIYASEPYLPDLLDDHAALRRLPQGSLGQDYCDMMQREGLSAAGLVEQFEACRDGRARIDDKVEWYLDRLRDTHDLLHLLTGFGRDVLGEQCVLTFVFKQRPSLGHLLTGYAGAMLTRFNTPWKVPVLCAVFEARQIGKLCPPIAELPIRALLAMPTDEVRARMNLRPAHYYHEANRIWSEQGIDPRLVLAKAGG